MLKVGVIGAGAVAGMHLMAYKGVEGAKPVYITDVIKERAENLAKNYNLKVKDSAEDIIKSDVDIIDICLPTTFHKEFTIKASQNKKHVFCEKPIARTIKDAEEMIKSCKENGVKLMIGHVLRFFHEYVKIKEAIDSGKVGKVGVVRLSRCAGFPKGGGNWYRDFEKSGGVVLDMILHDFDWLRWCFGEPERVYARGLAYTKLKDEIDYALVTIRFKNGVIAHVEGSWAEGGGFKTEVEIAGDEGLLSFKSQEAPPISLNLKETEGGPAVAIPESPVEVSPFSQELQEFVNSINEDREPQPSAEEALKSLKLALSILNAIKTQEVVKL